MLNLQTFNCTRCGGTLIFDSDGLHAKCKHCTTEHFFKEDKAEALIMELNTAAEYLKRNDFDNAITHYSSIMKRYPEDPEAAWGFAISTYGIVYAHDERTGKMIPTCSRIVKGSILDFPAYKTALESSAEEQKALYESEAAVIDKLQKRIKRAMEDEEDFDVFISFKAQDENGSFTEDISVARNIYDELTKRGIKTFFSDVTLAGRIGDEYEPIIYRALYSCKFFILVATDEKYVEAPWVKNEWTRFRDRAYEENLTGSATAVFKNVKPYALPKIFGGQGISLDRHPFDYAQLIADNLATRFGIVNPERERMNAALEAERRRNEENERKMRAQFEESQRKLKEEQDKKLRELQEQLKAAQEATPAPVSVEEKSGEDKKPAAKTVKKTAKPKPKKATGEPVSQKASAENQIKYKLSDDGEYAIAYECDKSATNVVVASEYEGRAVKVIGDGAFSKCKSLVSVTLPPCVERINKQAFHRCEMLKEITIPDGVKFIGPQAFLGCMALRQLKLPSSVEVIEFGAFSRCENLISVDLPNSVKDIGASAFTFCKNLASVSIPSGIERINNLVFYYCERLGNITIHEGVKFIGSQAFSGCKALRQLKLPSSVEVIESGAFSECENLVSIELPSGVKAIGSRAFSCCHKLKGFNVPKCVVKIEDNTFYQCRSLLYVGMPSGIKSIGIGAFRESGLISVSLPVGVKTVSDSAFMDCAYLESINLPEAVKTIEPFAFSGCEKLKKVNYGATKSQWKEIKLEERLSDGVNSGDGNSVLKKAVIHCSDGDIKPGFFSKLFG